MLCLLLVCDNCSGDGSIFLHLDVCLLLLLPPLLLLLILYLTAVCHQEPSSPLHHVGSRDEEEDFTPIFSEELHGVEEDLDQTRRMGVLYRAAMWRMYSQLGLCCTIQASLIQRGGKAFWGWQWIWNLSQSLAPSLFDPRLGF